MATLQEIADRRERVMLQVKQVLLPLAERYKAHELTQADLADALNDAMVPTIRGLPGQRWSEERAGVTMRDIMAEAGLARQCDLNRRAKCEAKAQEVLEILSPFLAAYRAGLVTQKALAAELNDRGIKNVSGGDWTDKNVAYVLAQHGVMAKDHGKRKSVGGGTDDVKANQQVQEARKHLCHGWIDSYGRKHPCKRKRHIVDYRCDDCWTLTRQCAGSDWIPD